ncbi:hypothetical protein C1645_739147 [Glomus cerebriforme]|uniref:Uncharacterized protein n=1 Tax=Glomus cerebriforme TaxID=658196 RepID=A0A397SSS9_9GLOM|nr:hypothetical protein C1645_739147 [Glomus cerebriforme]
MALCTNSISQKIEKIVYNPLYLLLYYVPSKDDQLSNLSLQVQDELLATKKILKYFFDSPPEEHIHVIVKLSTKCSVGQLDKLTFWTFVQNPVQNLSKTKTFFQWTGFGQIT